MVSHSKKKSSFSPSSFTNRKISSMMMNDCQCNQHRSIIIAIIVIVRKTIGMFFRRTSIYRSFFLSNTSFVRQSIGTSSSKREREMTQVFRMNEISLLRYLSSS